MLAHACLAILCGCRGYAAIAQWGRDQPIEPMHKLGYRRPPASYAAFQSPLSRLDAKASEPALGRWAEHLPGPPEADALRAVAIDGKTSRGGLTPLAAAVHLLAAMDQKAGCVLEQMRVDAEATGRKAALDLLAEMALKGRVVAGDAMFCRRDLSEQVPEDGGHYLRKVGENQPSPKRAIESAIEPACSPLRAAVAAGRGGPSADGHPARRSDRDADLGGDDDARRDARVAGAAAGLATGASRIDCTTPAT